MSLLELPLRAGPASTLRLTGLSGLARAGLLAALFALWLGTAIFPCCKMLAAVLGGHPDRATQPAAAAQPLAHPDATHSDCPDHSPEAPCSSMIALVPALVTEAEVPAPDRPPSDRAASSGPTAFYLAGVGRPTDPAPVRATAPPPPDFHQRTQRLLV